MELLFQFGWVAIIVGVFFALLLLMFSGMVRYISNDRIGVVEKLWSLSGSVERGLLALNGEAGFQPDIRRGGFHFFAPFQYRLHTNPMVSVT